MQPRAACPSRIKRLRRPCAAIGAISLVALAASLPGCALAYLGGAMAQAADEQSLIDVTARYAGLKNQTVAVVVNCGLDILYDHPNLVPFLTGAVTTNVGRQVEGVKMMRPDHVVAWQTQTPQWDAMPYAELIKTLGVDRIIYVDVYEYRLHPPGNMWLWEGVCAANIGIIERDGFDPDNFASTFSIEGRFPPVSGVDRNQAGRGQIEQGVMAEFVRKTAWLFYDHEEPKYPDKYRPELHR